ncbi:MAG TPA: beta-L-arabinofuranosidase domain-containing protein [Phycisphaerae bacterium]|nr:beta-L-arabinofuranosidase domain-containing protein [Phycisphaerae bacterium]
MASRQQKYLGMGLAALLIIAGCFVAGIWLQSPSPDTNPQSAATTGASATDAGPLDPNPTAIYAPVVGAEPAKGAMAVKTTAQPFPIGDVKILAGPFKHAQDLGEKYLLDLDTDRLLAPYYMAAGEPVKKPPYAGWESQRTFIAGHMLGHWLAGAARMSVVAGDAELKKRVDDVVTELAAMQAKNPSGYVGPCPERVFTQIFAGAQPNGNILAGQQVPWFTLDTMLAGLVDACEMTGNKQALEVATKLADWAQNGSAALNDDQFEAMLSVEQGGMCERLAELYAITGEKKYLDFSMRFAHHHVINALAGEQDQLTGMHANAVIPKLVGSEKVYEFTGQDEYQKAAVYFWDEVVHKRSYVIGGNSTLGPFTELGTEPLGTGTAETCNTYNMLRLTKELLYTRQESKYADYYEHALLNHILASQDPDTGMTTSFVSTKPGHFKVYSTPFDSTWCCTGTGLENPARYTDAIYTHGEATVWVNLYIASELQWKDKGLVLRQETNFPEEAGSKLTITTAPSGTFELRLRVPEWAAGPVVAKVNGKETARANAGREWLSLKRVWSTGDTVEIALPMALHTRPMIGDPNTISVLYGPVVLAAAMGRDGMPADDHARLQLQFDTIPSPPAPALVTSKDEPADWLKAGTKPLTFKTAGSMKPADLELIPFYQLHHERYTLYFPKMTAAAWAEKEKGMLALEDKTIDKVDIGVPASETGHKLSVQTSTRGNFNGRNWRDALNGGFFSFQLKVAAGENSLRVTYWGGETDARLFDILVDSNKVAEQQLANNKPGEFFDVDYPIPASLTKDKDAVEVKFQGQPGMTAGGVFGLRMMKK